ncbi:MAG: DUF1376 domain-containing protein [Betaproteobacteria bacterium]|nr:DUF1376 domain-containing protein [Betaproteobacteria bacterium]
MRLREPTSEIHFYEWYISRRQTSEAHDELDAAYRGIYREMLDICYAQGSVSSDLEILSRRCGCTVAEIEARWTVLRKHFRQDRTNKTRLVNDLASLFRKSHFEYVTKQQQNGAKGGTRKANRSKVLDSGGLANATQTPKPTRKAKL